MIMLTVDGGGPKQVPDWVQPNLRQAAMSRLQEGIDRRFGGSSRAIRSALAHPLELR
jgi:hypothetical protein